MSLNRYTYGFASPLVFWDPDGRFSTNTISLEGIRNFDEEKNRARNEVRGREGRASRLRFLKGEAPYDFASYQPKPSSSGSDEMVSIFKSRSGEADEDVASTGDEPVVDIVSLILSGGEGAVDASTLTIKLVEVDRGWLAYRARSGP